MSRARRKQRSPWLRPIAVGVLLFGVSLAALFALQSDATPAPRPEEQPPEEPEKKVVTAVRIAVVRPAAKPASASPEEPGSAPPAKDEPRPAAPEPPAPETQAEAEPPKAAAEPEPEPEPPQAAEPEPPAAREPEPPEPRPAAEERPEPPPAKVTVRPPPPAAIPQPRTTAQEPAPAPARPARPKRIAADVLATHSVIRRGRRLDQQDAIPQFSLLADDEEEYFAFYQHLGGRLFVECDGKVVLQVDPSASPSFRRPRVAGLDLSSPRVLSKWTRGRRLLRQAKREHELAGRCQMVMLVPGRVHRSIRHALAGGLARALLGGGGPSIGELSRVSGSYRLRPGGAPVVVLSRATHARGELPLDVRVELDPGTLR